MTRNRMRLAALLLTFMLPARPARSMEVTPFIGPMIPANSLIVGNSLGGYLRMQTHTVYGLGFGTTLTSRLDAEAVFAVGTGHMEVVGGTALSLASTAIMGDLRARMRVCGAGGSSLGAIVGVGYTDHKLGLFDYAHEIDSGDYIGRLTGVVGLDVRNDLSDRVRLRISAVDRIHEQGVFITGTTTGNSEKTQNDIVITAGLAFAVGK